MRTKKFVAKRVEPRGQRSFSRRDVLILGGTASGWSLVAKAQQRSALKHISVLMAQSEADTNAQEAVGALRTALRSLGWIEGTTARIEIYWADKDSARTDHLAAEIVASAPDIIVCHTPVATTAVRERTRTIPIVFVIVSDPVIYGFVKTLSRPGGNVTGISTFEFSMGSKWLQLLKEAAPQLKRAAILYQPSTILGWDTYLKSLENAAPASGLAVDLVPVEAERQIAKVADSISQKGDTGLIVPPQIFNDVYAGQYIKEATRLRLPNIFSFAEYARAGALMSYGVDYVGQFKQVAAYVDRILRGTNPGELPVQQPSKFQLVVNVQTAGKLGLTIPETLLATADQVIE